MCAHGRPQDFFQRGASYDMNFKITKGPPLVKIFWSKFLTKKLYLFLPRAHLSRKLYYFVMLFYHRKHPISPKFCMASIGDGVPGRGWRDTHVKFRLKYCHCSIKYCSGRIFFIRFLVFPACLHFGFASPAGREYGI